MAERLEIVADAEWIEAVKAAAHAAGGLSASAYIRLAVTEKMRRDGFPAKAKVLPPHRPKGRKHK